MSPARTAELIEMLFGTADGWLKGKTNNSSTTEFRLLRNARPSAFQLH